MTISFPAGHRNFCWLQYAISPLNATKNYTVHL